MVDLQSISSNILLISFALIALCCLYLLYSHFTKQREITELKRNFEDLKTIFFNQQKHNDEIYNKIINNIDENNTSVTSTNETINQINIDKDNKKYNIIKLTKENIENINNIKETVINSEIKNIEIDDLLELNQLNDLNEIDEIDELDFQDKEIVTDLDKDLNEKENNIKNDMYAIIDSMKKNDNVIFNDNDNDNDNDSITTDPMNDNLEDNNFDIEDLEDLNILEDINDYNIDEIDNLSLDDNNINEFDNLSLDDNNINELVNLKYISLTDNTEIIELDKLLSGDVKNIKLEKQNTISNNKIYQISELNNMSSKQLKEIAKEYKIKAYGSKNDIIQTILNVNN